VTDQACPAAKPRLLLSCYFPRSVELEGVGALVLGIASGMVQQGWLVTLLLPAGIYKDIPGVDIVCYCSAGLAGLRRYRLALAKHSAQAQAVVLVENNPCMVNLADASSQPGRTFCIFYTPLQGLGVLAELGFSRQGLLHMLAKNRLLARLRSWRNRRCIVASEFQARQIRHLGAKVWVLPVCGTSANKPIPDRATARASLGWDAAPVVGYLGHYSPAKGVSHLLKAMEQAGGPAVLALAYSGKGHLDKAGQAGLESLRKAGRLRQMGVMSATTFLAACDVVALPFVTSSIHHPPQVMLESFAAATAVISTSVGGMPEFVLSDRTGLLVRPGDSSALAKAVSQLLADLPRTHAMGKQGRGLFESQYSREVFCQQLSNIIMHEVPK
jgi:glycosyltransferase involved in cell wall biosynthesis